MFHVKAFSRVINTVCSGLVLEITGARLVVEEGSPELCFETFKDLAKGHVCCALREAETWPPYMKNEVASAQYVAYRCCISKFDPLSS